MDPITELQQDLERLCQEIVRQDELRGADLKEMREILSQLCYLRTPQVYLRYL